MLFKKFLSKLNEKKHYKKLKNDRWKCAKVMAKTIDINKKKCPGIRSSHREFGYVEEKCFNCKYWN